MKKMYLGVFIFIFFNCEKDIQPDLENSIIDYIEKTVDSDMENKTIKVLDLTSFYWDRLYIFYPYIEEREMKRILKTNINIDTSIKALDSISLLVFTKDDNIIKVLDFPRVKGDFVSLFKETGYLANEAIFNIEVKDGWIYVTGLENK